MTSSNRLTRKELGAFGERVAADFLQQNGFCMLAVNWRCRSGELDIVAQNDKTLLFVEVRTRTNTGTFGTARESIDIRKQRQVRETAKVFLHMKQWDEAASIRFDVICVTCKMDGSLHDIDHIPDAF